MLSRVEHERSFINSRPLRIRCTPNRLGSTSAVILSDLTVLIVRINKPMLNNDCAKAQSEVNRHCTKGRLAVACDVYDGVFLCCPFSHEMSWMGP